MILVPSDDQEPDWEWGGSWEVEDGGDGDDGDSGAWAINPFWLAVHNTH